MTGSKSSEEFGSGIVVDLKSETEKLKNQSRILNKRSFFTCWMASSLCVTSQRGKQK